MWRLALLLSWLAGGCSTLAPFLCQTNDVCVRAGVEGVCTIYGFCSFRDDRCPYLYRYDRTAGELASVCVGDEDSVGFDPDGMCRPSAEYCGDGMDSDCFGDGDPTCPAGDAPSAPIDITALDQATVDIRYARNDYAPSCAMPGGRDAFFQFTLDQPELVYLDTQGSDFDAVLVLRSGPCSAIDSSVPELGCGHLTCSTSLAQVVAPLEPGTYCAIVDQYDLQTATFGGSSARIRLQHRPRAPLLAAATVGGDTCGATDAVASSCAAQEGGRDHSYAFTLCAESRAFTADTCGASFPNVVALTGPGEQRACASGCTDGKGISAALEGPGLYVVTVDGDRAASCGAFELHIQH